MQTVQLQEHLLQEAYRYLSNDTSMTRSPNDIVELALREFIKNRSEQAKANKIHDTSDIFGFSQGDVQILGDIISPTTTDDDWNACQ